MIFNHILAKIALLCIMFFGIFTLGVVRVHAEVVTTHQKIIEIVNENEVRYQHIIDIRNNTVGRILNNYVILTPYDQVKNIRAFEGRFSDNFRYRDNKINVSLRTGLLYGQSTKLRISYSSTAQLTKPNKLIEFRLPKFNAEETVSKFSTTLVYPDNFPQLIFVQGKHFRQQNQLSFDENQAIHLLWGTKASVVIDETLSLNNPNNARLQQLVNLPYRSKNQEVIYRTLDKVQLLSDVKGNIWAVLTGNLHYRALLQTQANKYTFDDSQVFNREKLNYPGLTLPENIKQQSAKLNTAKEKAEILYKYLINNYVATESEVNSRNELNLQIQQLSADGGSNRAGMLLINTTLAKWFSELDIPVSVEYGFHFGADWPNFDERSPAMWLEVDLGETRRILEPYLAMRTGYDLADMPVGDRVKFGTWQPENSVDTVLGLLGQGLRTRPDIVAVESSATDNDNVLGLDTGKITWDFQAPAHAFAGNAYTGKLTVNNDTDEVVQLKHLYWDNQDHSAALKSIDANFSLAIAPRNSVVIDVKSLMWPTLLFEGNYEHFVEVGIVGATPLQGRYSIFYTPTPLLEMGLGAAVMLTILLICLVFYRKFRLSQIKYLALQRIQTRV